MIQLVRVESYFGEDEAVVAGVTGVFRSVFHGVEEEHRHDLGHAAAWCGMTATKWQISWAEMNSFVITLVSLKGETWRSGENPAGLRGTEEQEPSRCINQSIPVVKSGWMEIK